MNGDQGEAQAWSPAGALRAAFEAATGQAATSRFAAWIMESLSDRMLIGLGNDPGNENGAVVVSSADGQNFLVERLLDEQGVVDWQKLTGDEIWLPGLDPTDDWTLGNLYHRTAGAWAKLRTMPLTIHAFGLWSDGATIYVAAGAHTGDNQTWAGRVLKSLDDGATWQAFDVNAYRVTDVIGFDGRLYATGLDWNGSDYQYELYRSDDDGQTWQTLPVSVRYRPRLTVWNGALYAVDYDQVKLVRIALGGGVTEHAVPFVILNEWQVLQGSSSGLYVLASDGTVWRSADLVSWSAYAHVAGAVSLWVDADDVLWLSTCGPDARIWVA